MQIKLDLSKHCIETEIKKRYNQSISEYFKIKPPDSCLEHQIENLKEALTSLDFGHLRKEFPALAGNHDNEVILSFDSRNNISILINGKQIKCE
jgi:hypothetical protein